MIVIEKRVQDGTTHIAPNGWGEIGGRRLDGLERAQVLLRDFESVSVDGGERVLDVRILCRDLLTFDSVVS